MPKKQGGVKMYFEKCKTLEELKNEYRKLAMLHHPDRKGGNLEEMQKINGSYDRYFQILKNEHINFKGESYQKETAETPEEFKDIISELLKMQGIEIELIGSFLWLSGNTKQYKDEIKKLGFSWHSKKLMWYKAPNGYVKCSRKTYTIDEIRGMYGSETVKGKGKIEQIA